ncbi:MAG: hypothetical protein ABL916_01410 [Burkholderiaceae bacterium]
MTTHLHLKHWATLGAIALAASSSFAADAPARTRADVNAQTLAARADGTLVPAGEGVDTRGPAIDTRGPAIDTRGPAIDSRSALSRADVAADVIAARASGRLLAAGEAADPATRFDTATTPILARAAVKADVIAARASGDLVPAGEGLIPEAQQRSRAAAAWMAKARQNKSATLDTARAAQANTASTSQQ